MAHFAKLDSNNTVVDVNVVNNAMLDPNNEEATGVEFLISWSNGYTNWVQTSYNAATNGFRKQYAGIGYSYDADLNIFIAPQPYPSWILDVNHDWQPPTPMPTDGKQYVWFEPNKQWIELV